MTSRPRLRLAGNGSGKEGLLPSPFLLLWRGDKAKKLGQAIIAGTSYEPEAPVKKGFTAAVTTGITYEPEVKATAEICAGPDEPLPPPPPEKKEIAVGPDPGGCNSCHAVEDGEHDKGEGGGGRGREGMGGGGEGGVEGPRASRKGGSKRRVELRAMDAQQQ